MKRAIALLLGLCFLLGGCAQNGAAPTPDPADTPISVEPSPAPDPGQTTQPDQPSTGGTSDFRQLALRLAEMPDLTTGFEPVDETYGSAFTDYTLRTARKLFENATGNVVYSPANLYLALCMLVETAGGESRDQVLDLLGLESVEQARAASAALFRELYRDTDTGRTLLANSIWLNEQVDFKQDTVDHLATDYVASAFRAPMGSSATDKAIADWVNENTNNLLSDAAAGLKTRPETLMMLISTLYFKGTWRDQFEESFNTSDTFTDAAGAEHTVDFMHTFKSRSTCYRGDHFTAASLPFVDGTEMWFLLPDEGVTLQDVLFENDALLDELAANPSAALDMLNDGTVASQIRADVSWSVPKFDVDSDLDLIPALRALGVTDVFDGSAADFSPLTDLDAVISAVKHAARVKVNEEGCEAAAFTAMMLAGSAMAPEDLPLIEMNLNRPFGFLITGADGLPLFLSIVNSVE